MDLNKLKIDRSTTTTGGAGRARRRRVPVGWLVLLAILAGLFWVFRGRVTDLVDRLRLPAVATARPTRPAAAAASALSGAAANGYIVARVRAALSADTPGRIIELNVVEGQAVKKGFVVARLYSAEYESAVQRADAELTAGRAALERAKADLDAQASTVARLLAAQAATDARQAEAEADLKLANAQFARIDALVQKDLETEGQRDEWRARVETGRARVDAARKDLATAVAAVAEAEAQKSALASAVAEAAARVKSLEASAAEARATLDKTYVRAPFDGIVVLKDAEVGEVVSPNSQAGGSARGAVATMVDFSSLEAQAEVPETSINAVTVGAPARIFLDAFPSHGYTGVVDRIWPTANRQKATIEVRVKITDPDERLRPEMGARIVFIDAAAETRKPEPSITANALLVPAACVVRDDGADAVFVVERGRVALRRIQTAGTRGSDVVVLGGVSEAETLVRDPPANLADGDRVRTSNEP